MPKLPILLTIGQLAARSGVAASALRFYEDKGLIGSTRTGGNQRRYTRGTLRRVAVIRAAQGLGIPLRSIRTALEALPDQRTPTKRDWEKLSRHWRGDLEARIAELELLHRRLASCIGCGCLSLSNCTLFNPDDGAAEAGAGPRYLMGDEPVARPSTDL